MARKLGDGCGWLRMLTNFVLLVNRGLGAGGGNIMELQWLGWVPIESGWDMGCCFSVAGRVNHRRGMGGVHRAFSMRVDKSATALDMSVIAFSRRSRAWWTR